MGRGGYNKTTVPEEPVSSSFASFASPGQYDMGRGGYNEPQSDDE